jgi:Amt family ammonium transporter
LPPEIANALTLLLILLVPCAGAGLALINAGLGRSRSAAHSMVGALAAIGVAALVYFAVGFAWQGYPGGVAHTFALNGKTWNWIAGGNFFLRGVDFDGSAPSLAAIFGLFAVGLAAIIPLGSGAERWRLGGICCSTALLAGWTYPWFAHWVWGGGWLADLGRNYGLGRGFLDCGGAGSIQCVGGLTALAITWILGPRRGKYTAGGMPAAIPGHNAVLVLFGCFLAWLGWLGLGSAGAVLFAGTPFGRTALVAVNLTLSAVSAAAAAAALTRSRFGKADASLCANGWVAGLVAGSAGCALMRPAAAVIVGGVAGALAIFTVESLELRLTVDDPGGAISVHAVGGIWGLLAVGMFTVNAAPGQWLAQLVGVATLVGFVLPLAYGLNLLLNRFYRLRAAPEAERQGLDLHELGAGAYPEFMSHTDDSWLR